MTATCHRAIRSLRACERLNLIAAVESTLKARPLMAAHSRRLALDCRRDARLLQTTSLPNPNTTSK